MPFIEVEPNVNVWGLVVRKRCTETVKRAKRGTVRREWQ